MPRQRRTPPPQDPAGIFRAFCENSPDGFVLVNHEGRFVYANEAAARCRGYTMAEFLGLRVWDITAHEGKADFERRFASAIQGGHSDFETVHKRKDGSLLDVAVSLSTFLHEGRKATCAIWRDITASKQAREDLRRSEARFQALIENSLEGVMIVDAAGVIRYTSPAFAAILGYGPDEREGRHIREFVHPDEMARVLEGFLRVAATPGLVSPRELRIRHKDGSWRTIEGRATNHLANPHIEGILINFRDVTTRRMAEDHLIESERLYRALVETTNTGYVVVDTDGRVADANPEYVRLTGHKDITEIRGRSVLEWTAPHEKDMNAEAVAQCAQDGFIRGLEIDYVDRQGRRTPIEIDATVVKTGEKPLILTLCRDITERRKAEAALRRSEASLRAIFESLPFDIFALDKDGRYFMQNTACKEHWDVVLGKRPEDLGVERQTLAVWQENNRRAFSGQRVDEESTFSLKSGPRWFHNIVTPITDGGRVTGILGVNIDITARKEAEAALRRSEIILNDAERLAGMGSFDCDILGRKVRRSEGIYLLFGERFDEDPDGFLRYVHPDDRDWVRGKLTKSMSEGAPFREDYRIVRPDGTQRIIHAEGEVTKDEAGRPVRFFGWLQDITERRGLEKKVLQIGDRERLNIGQDLHDDLGQQLTGIALLGRALQGRLSAQGSPEAGAISDLLQHLDRALAHVRKLSRGLASVPERPEGLAEALAGLTSQVQSTAGITCSLRTDRPVLVPDAAVANHLLRIAQEAVQNALRHGKPTTIKVSLTQEERLLTLSVEDDGTGILDSPKKDAGMGLDIMRHRATLIHGTLTLSSHAGKGTSVICRVPQEGGTR